MAIRAVVFDIGGVLEITPPTGWVEKWEARLHLKAGELDERLMDVSRAGSLGTISEEEVEKRIGEILHSVQNDNITVALLSPTILLA